MESDPEELDRGVWVLYDVEETPKGFVVGTIMKGTAEKANIGTTKMKYQETIRGKMMEMRNNRGRRRR